MLAEAACRSGYRATFMNQPQAQGASFMRPPTLLMKKRRRPTPTTISTTPSTRPAALDDIDNVRNPANAIPVRAKQIITHPTRDLLSMP